MGFHGISWDFMGFCKDIFDFMGSFLGLDTMLISFEWEHEILKEFCIQWDFIAAYIYINGYI